MSNQTPVINNIHMNPDDFIYSDGKYDYCIVNGESLTKYFGKEPGEYESYPVHTFMSPLSVIKNTKWLSIILKYDYLHNRKYKKHAELMKTISNEIEYDLFGDLLSED